MKFSLKTKFYIYILPLFVVMPILLYSLIVPYTQLQQGFGQFKTDANRAFEVEQLGVSLATEHLELFHFLAAAPDTAYELTTNPNYKDFTTASKDVENQTQNLDNEITQSVAPDDLEKELIDKISAAHIQYKSLTDQVLELSSRGQKTEAYKFLGAEVGGFVDSELHPEVEKLEIIKEDDVKTSLPFLTQNLTRNGIIPIPGLKERINLVLARFENSVDTESIDQHIDDLQASVFYQVTQPVATNSAISRSQSQSVDDAEIKDEVTTILKNLRSNLSKSDDSEELKLIDQFEQIYTKMIALDNQALGLAVSGKKDEGLLLLSNEVDDLEVSSLDPILKKLTDGDKKNIQNEIRGLSNEIDVITILMYIFGGIVFLVGLAGLWKLSHDIIAPIITLRNATATLATGDFGTRVKVSSRDEIGQLGQNFNDMAQKLQNSYGNLEERVRVQTYQLSSKVGELEQNKKGMLNILEDLNQEKLHLQQKEEALNEAQHAGKIGSFTWDLQTNVITWTKEMFDLMQVPFSNKAPTIELFMQHIYPEDRDKIGNNIKDSVSANTTFNGEFRVQYADKTIHWMQAKGQTIFKDNKPSEVLGTVQDVTHEKELEKLKDEFVSIASHELRTPMTAIKGFISMIEEGDYGPVDEGLKEPLTDIQSSVERLIHLVNDMLNVSRIEAGRMKFNISVFDIKPAIEEIVASLQPIAKAKNIKLQAEELSSIMISADSDKVKQILNNIIGNSLKFTDTGSIITTLKQDGQLLKVYVADTGMGISPKDQEKLFGKFQQVSSQQAGKPAGTGLGLYLSKQLCNKMGGDLWIEQSVLDKGSIFGFSVPILQSEIALRVKNELAKESEIQPDQKDS